MVLERPVGSLVQHPPRVLHAVTCLTEGTRKSLFIVDRSNGLGDNDVLTVTQEDVDEFKESIRPKLPTCLVCLEGTADHIIFPCGHVCFCAVCANASAVNACPKCRGGVQHIQKILL